MNEAIATLTRHKLDADAFERMGTAGILPEDARVELIDGSIIDMAPIGQLHAAIVGAMTRALFRACGDRAIVWVQSALWLDDHNVVRPDFTVLRLRADQYMAPPRPGPADALLVVEVAHSSQHYDRRVKLPLYAAGGIPEYWILDTQAQVLDAYRHPEGGRYAEPEPHRSGDRVALAAMPEIVVSLDFPFG